MESGDDRVQKGEQRDEAPVTTNTRPPTSNWPSFFPPTFSPLSYGDLGSYFRAGASWCWKRLDWRCRGVGVRGAFRKATEVPAKRRTSNAERREAIEARQGAIEGKVRNVWSNQRRFEECGQRQEIHFFWAGSHRSLHDMICLLVKLRKLRPLCGFSKDSIVNLLIWRV